MIKFLLHPDLISAELSVAGTVVRVTGDGLETSDPNTIATLDAYDAVYRDGDTVPEPGSYAGAPTAVEPVPDKTKGGKS